MAVGLCEITAEFAPGLVALREVLVHRAQDQPIERRRNVRAMRGRRRRVDIQYLVEQAGLVRPDERQFPRQQLIHHHAERINVGLMRQFLVLDLFRRHVGGRADALKVRVLTADMQGHAEIADLDVVACSGQDVCRFDITVNDAVTMSKLEGQAALESDFDHAIHRQQAGHIAEIRQRRAHHVLHHDVAVFVGHVRIVNRHDVRMSEFSHQRGLVQKYLVVAPSQLRVDPIRRVHDFNGDFPIGERIAAQVNAAGAATGNFADYRILADLVRQRVIHIL